MEVYRRKNLIMILYKTIFCKKKPEWLDMYSIIIVLHTLATYLQISANVLATSSVNDGCSIVTKHWNSLKSKQQLKI